MMPTIMTKDERGVERWYDLASRMLKDRIIFIDDEINSVTASSIIMQLLTLESENRDAPITIYINSPGGSISDGMAIYDVMNKVKCPIITVCLGMAASMGAFLLSCGTRGKRYCLPNSTVMIHQPLGGGRGQATEIEIHAREILRMRKELNGILSKHTGQPIDVIHKDTERDNFMTAEEAKAYGLIDEILTRPLPDETK